VLAERRAMQAKKEWLSVTKTKKGRRDYMSLYFFSSFFRSCFAHAIDGQDNKQTTDKVHRHSGSNKKKYGL